MKKEKKFEQKIFAAAILLKLFCRRVGSRRVRNISSGSRYVFQIFFLTFLSEVFTARGLVDTTGV